ncbi:tRNA pseudouridine(38-40) synthase TruA [Bacillus sp. ISL-40]|uniref:tRNA pseudouridine(38-40) synthase TruA n=1 Tax=unclassified Bacillus (in: firmicutes) TaxID=185979 RepID=UPI001BE9A1C2|nr:MULTISPECIES: tRNA pseudouridine(38-40) synthase TruA [unclassified Bacillus (in: firmicutes)]MBT2698325.1 tRNA pseudouridine(38-40) synthase TruA [Bacillus sp. ISL-40]MBT2724265.1 tRNA pseudouridine(38-40) synthase TruA [Bacillus sp. ISL-46]MBT2742930.1 tRNA pseudouridine(38-40) synthase TruA [Bacillus sp. ISL-77]
MARYKCIISYDGSGFSGYQVQPNKRTVQSVLEDVLSKMHKGDMVKVVGSGRTDAGVHAKGQVIHFDSPLLIPADKWEKALNSMLPEDISVLKVVPVTESFHARFDAKGKEYRYVLHLSQKRDPFQRKFAYQYPYRLNLQAMEQASKLFLGTHDFTSFCAAKTEVVDKVRTIESIDFTRKDESLTIRFVGNGFLYNMVRILVGTLLEVGSGERSPEDIPIILAHKDRRLSGKTAPGHGLYLWEVFYE